MLLSNRAYLYHFIKCLFDICCIRFANLVQSTPSNRIMNRYFDQTYTENQIVVDVVSNQQHWQLQLKNSSPIRIPKERSQLTKSEIHHQFILRIPTHAYLQYPPTHPISFFLHFIDSEWIKNELCCMYVHCLSNPRRGIIYAVELSLIF